MCVYEQKGISFIQSDLGPDNIPGYTKVLNLASFLLLLKDQDQEGPMTSAEVNTLIRLWADLSPYDQRRTNFPDRFAASPGTGRFKSPKKQVAMGVTSIKR